MTVYDWNGFNGSFNDPNMWTNLSTHTTPSGPPGGADIAEFDKNGTVSGNGGVGSVNVIGASLGFVGNISTQNFSVDSQGVADFSGGAVVDLGTGGMSIGNNSSGTVTAATINGGTLAVQDSDLQVAFQGHIVLTAGVGNFTVGEPQFTDLPSTFELNYGGSVIDITAIIGGTSGATATVAGGIWSSTGGMNVGSSGNGTLAIGLGGTVSTGAGGALAIGALRGETGTVTVSGGGSMLVSNYATDIVGGVGNGDLAINLTATATVAGLLDLGVASLAHGTLVVSDARSSLVVGGALIIGDAGIATGTIAADASASVANGLTIGNLGGGTGTLTVTDAGTQLSVGGAVIGGSGAGTLDVQAGAAFPLNSGSVVVGAVHGGSGNVTVSGSTTTLQAGNGLTIGALGFGSLSVQFGAMAGVAGGTLDLGTLDLGTGLNATGVVALSGIGSALTLAAGPAIIGDAGAGTLAVAAGALFSNSSGATTIGGNIGGVGTLAVAGSNALANLGTLIVGGLGNGTLNVGAAGSVATTQAITIAAGTSSLSLLSVSGAGANLTDGGNLVVGEGGHGTLIVQSSGSVGVAAGSLVIGDAKGSTGMVALGGALGGSLAIGQGITVGNAGFGTFDLEANAGLALAAGTIDIGAAKGGVGTLALATSGVTLTAPGTIVVGDSGTGTLQVIAGTSLNAAAGTMIIGAASGGAGVVTVSGAAAAASLGALIIGEAGNGTLAISSGATVTDPNTVVVGQGTGGGGALTLSGVATSLVDGGNLVVGASGDGTVSVQGGATLQVNSGAVLIGAAAGASAGVTLAGTGTPLQIGSNLTVGQSGNGTLNVQAGVTLDVNSGAVTVGAATGGSGEIILAGTGTMFSAAQAMTVGSAGHGTLRIGAGAGLSVAGALDVGAAQGGAGTITLLGSQSALTASASVTIGDAGNGTLTLASGARVTTSNDVVIGNNAGGAGSVAVNGANSLLDDGGGLTVGAAGSGEIDINQGSVAVSSGVVILGQSGSAAGSISLMNSALDLTGSLVIGDAGSGSISVGLGGTLQAQHITLGEVTNGSGNLLVDGVGALAWSSDLTIGLGGTGWLDVNAQGSLDTIGAAVLGTEALPVVQQATILGQAMWTVGNGLTVGNAGNAVMVIGTGGTVFAGSVVLGDQGGATGSVTVAGTIGTGGGTAASSLFFGGELVVGNSGTAELAVNQGGVVGSPTSPAGTIEIGAQTGGVGSVSVSGAASSLNAAVLAVGGSGDAAGGAGTLSIGAGATVDGGTVTVWSGGTIALGGGDLATASITVDGEVTGYGTIGGSIVDDGTIVADGGTLILSGSIGGLGTLAFGGVATLVLGAPGSGVTLPVTGLAGRDRIEFTGLTITGAQVTSPGTVTISTTGANYLLSNVSFAPGALQTFFTGHDSTTGNDYIQVQCFAAGTRIAGPHGEVAVETLRVGDSVALAEGGAAEVIWIGRRTVETGRHPAPHKVWPVRITAGAFGAGASGAGVPHRDLFLSPDHAVFIEDVLIPIKRLLNGSTIVQMQVDRVSYYHIELAQHDVMLAEGLPVESYLDTGDRSDFVNGGGPVRLYPDFNVLAWEALGCARLVTTGPELDAARARIASIAATRGTPDPITIYSPSP